MREIKYASDFKRDYRMGTVRNSRQEIDKLLVEAVKLLAVEEALPRRYFDRELT
jgi:mRNA interferase YafQ